MKHQYFGDINDYRKYGLLRLLAEGTKKRVGICWMQTPCDHSGQGGRIGYLEKPKKWREYDAELFDSLKEIVVRRHARDLRFAEGPGILPTSSFSFFPNLLPGDPIPRSEYFKEMVRQFNQEKVGLVFFDPDTGLAPPSAPSIRKRSPKHLYWDELSNAVHQDYTVLVIQFFPFVPRKRFISECSQEIRERTNASQVISFQTPSAVFFLVLQQKDFEYFQSVEGRVTERWLDQIGFTCHL